jgi:hypothetical protein
MSRLRLLGVVLCYNDGDILADALQHLLNTNHDVVAWNHGSTDDTAAVLDSFRGHLVEATDISRSVDFYDLYPLMSKHLLSRYVDQYDWISWPDQDELLEGPTREKTYDRFIADVAESGHQWIEFEDFVYWFTERDNPSVTSPCERVRYYSLARHGSPKIRAWKASATNIRWFNHNKAEGTRYPTLFNLRHYPMRSEAQMKRRIAVDRAGLQQGTVNFHYENMRAILPSIAVTADDLHYDDGRSDLDPALKFDWTRIYGRGPKLPRELVESYMLPTRRWQIASVLKTSLGKLPPAAASRLGDDRLRRWLNALDGKIACPVVITFAKDHVRIVTEALARDCAGNPGLVDEIVAPKVSRSVDTVLGAIPVSVAADSAARSIRVVAANGAARQPDAELGLAALVPCFGGEPPRLAEFHDGIAEFTNLKGMFYYLASDSGVACAC